MPMARLGVRYSVSTQTTLSTRISSLHAKSLKEKSARDFVLGLKIWYNLGKMENKPQILIVDLGSQYTQIIRRSLRYLGYHSIVLPPEKSLEWVKENSPKTVILSGGSFSVYEKN